MTTEQDWLDALNGPIQMLIDVVITFGIIGIVLSILLLIARSPKQPKPRRR